MLDFGAFCFMLNYYLMNIDFFRRKYEKKIIRLMLISLGIILILVVGYRLYLEYQTDIQLFLIRERVRQSYSHIFVRMGLLHRYS